MKTPPIQIVLVEDDPCDAELALCELKAFRLAQDFVHLPDGEAALDFFFNQIGAGTHPSARSCPRLLFLDLGLPKVDGLAVLARLKSNPRTRAIPTVILTGRTDESLLAASYDLGADGYLIKPLTREKLLTLTGQLLLARRLAAPVPRRAAVPPESPPEAMVRPSSSSSSSSPSTGGVRGQGARTRDEDEHDPAGAPAARATGLGPRSHSPSHFTLNR